MLGVSTVCADTDERARMEDLLASAAVDRGLGVRTGIAAEHEDRQARRTSDLGHPIAAGHLQPQPRRLRSATHVAAR